MPQKDKEANQQSIPELFKGLWEHFTQKRRRQLGLLMMLMILASLAEIVSIGAVIPFLGALTAPQRIYDAQIIAPAIKFFAIISAKELVLPITTLFFIATVLACALRLILLWTSTRLSFAIGADFSISIYRRSLYQPYAIQVRRNSSLVINAISSHVTTTIYAINAVLTLFNSSIVLIAILITLIVIDPLIALESFGSFGLIYFVMIGLSRRRLLLNSQQIAHDSPKAIKALQEGLGGIRDILIDGTQATFCDIYHKADLNLRQAQASNIFISQSPRYGVEALGMLLIAGLAYKLTQQPDGLTKAIPTLGALALGAQRLLPLAQLAYQSWTYIRGTQSSLEDTLFFLNQPTPHNVNEIDMIQLPFVNQIQLNQVSFRYGPQTPWVLRNVDLKILKGSRVGFIGKTGSGKSTLLDIVMGLLEVTEGSFSLDGNILNSNNIRYWQAHIAHVPQVIFLSDSSIAENIAFGVPQNQIDLERVRLSAHQAQIGSTIEGWSNQYQTVIGERGISLSGGQLQRIGIARALYKGADVIIFDEATSALDTETEKAVMEGIEGLNKNLTILIIAHRITTLKNCDQIIEIGNKGIECIGSYQEIINKIKSPE